MRSLTDAVKIKNCTLRNRLVMPALTINAADIEGLVTNEVIDFYAQRSRSVGLVIVEATAVRGDGCLVPGSLGLWSDDQKPGMARLVETIRKNGTAVVIQLNHAGPRCVPREGRLTGVSPSGIQFRSDIEAKIMTEKEIGIMVGDFAAAAKRAVDAGFDGVEIHGAHFYLLSQFISPYTNHRKDRYGGSVGGRAAFPLEVVEAVREAIGANPVVLFRLNAVEKAVSNRVERDTLIFSRMLATAGVDLIDVSYAGPAVRQEYDDGSWQLVMTSALSRSDGAGANIDQATAIKQAAGLPVITVGKMAHPAAVKKALENENADLIAIGRQFIADPDTGEKLLQDRYDALNLCKECFTCFATIRRGEQMRCDLW